MTRIIIFNNFQWYLNAAARTLGPGRAGANQRAVTAR